MQFFSPRRVIFLLAAFLIAPSFAAGQGTKADYDRAFGLADRYKDKVARARVDPQWMSPSRFWYRVDLGDGRGEFVYVDAEQGQRRLAFDHEVVAKALSRLRGGDELEAERLPIERIAVDEAGVLTAARVNERGWVRWNAEAGAFEEFAEGQQPDTTSRRGWRPRGRDRRLWSGGDRPSDTSPDGRWRVVLRDGALVLRDKQKPEDENDQEPPTDEATNKDESSNAAEPTEFEKAPAPSNGNHFANEVFWAPDSSAFVAWEVSPDEGRVFHIVESSPKDSHHGKLHTINYLKPGDKVEQRWPRLFPVGEASELPVDRALFENPWSTYDLRWQADSSRFTFRYNQRGHQALRLVSIDAATGQSRAVIDERSETFIDYSYKQFLHYLDDAGELVWMSERDGWNHLYLIDADSGEVKRQLTRGPWVVRGVEHVDADRREVTFSCGGIYGEQDPYYVHFARVNLETGEITRLTEGNGTHEIRYSPDRDYYVDSYSRVDMPPVTELRRFDDGSLVCELERGDATKLVEAGWRSPETFVAKGRDGRTDIYGVIYRPTNFDPEKKYPVVEEHYAGPHSAHCPKSFSTLHRRPQQMAELGFIVFQLDGMGTSHRSKAFHDVACKNLVDGGFPDRIAWIKAAADHEPAMDLSRVGIRGTSAGGQTGMAAMLWHNDFYKVCVSNCGCHDNRVDKIWWNEAWMGWPVGPHYAEQSNVTNAHRLEGDLLLIVGEMDRNVDPISTLQVVNALIKADKDFDMLVVPGEDHGAGPYAWRRSLDFLVEKLHGVEPRRDDS